MKVLQINSVCGYGSTGKIVADINNVLLASGNESLIAYGRKSSPKDIKTIKIGSDKDIAFHVLQSRLFDKHGFGSVSATKKLISQIEASKPDIFHLHNLHGYYVNVELLLNYLAEAKRPVVMTLHDCWTFTGHCAYFDYIGCDKWITECRHCPQIRQYPSSLFYDNSKNNYNKKSRLFNSLSNLQIVTPSVWLAGLVKQSFLGNYPVEVINNGVDLSIYKPTEGDFIRSHNLVNKFIILGVASVWEERKGLKYFIELSKKIGDDCRIVLVGVSKKQQQYLPGNIIGISRTNNVQELVEIYTAADVFVNPTLEDNFPVTNIEALACGTPVITFDTGGSPECIDESCGFVAEKGNLEALVNGVRKIRTSPPDPHMCQQKATRYDKNTVYRSYLDIYNRLYDGMVK